MKKVLLICDLFPPQFAPRMGYLCKYIKDYGWEVLVLTSELDIPHDDKDFSFLAKCAEVERICVSNNEQQEYLEAQKYSLAKKMKAFFLPDYNRPPYLNEKMFSKGMEILRKQHFDAILCATFQTNPLGVAKRLSEIFNIPWIADLRDIQEQLGKCDIPFRDWMVMQRMRLRRNYLLRKAAAIVSISPWHINLLKKINPNVHLIYNGFDPDLFKFEQPRITPKFTMCYPGVVIDSVRDLSFLFTALSHLHSDKVINPDKFQVIVYASTTTHEYVMTHAKHYNIECLIDYKPYVNAAAIPEILHQSSILLLLANKSTPSGPNGIMTSKFFEYLGTGRPILLTRSDEGCLEEALVEAKAGMAARTVNDVYDFIKSKYLEWQTNGYTTGTTDQRIIGKYSRREQAKQFVSILDDIIK